MYTIEDFKKGNLVITFKDSPDKEYKIVTFLKALGPKYFNDHAHHIGGNTFNRFIMKNTVLLTQAYLNNSSRTYIDDDELDLFAPIIEEPPLSISLNEDDS